MHLGMKEKVVEKVKEDTWVLAIILGCFCLLCLLAGGVSAALQRKKSERGDKFAANIGHANSLYQYMIYMKN